MKWMIHVQDARARYMRGWGLVIVYIPVNLVVYTKRYMCTPVTHDMDGGVLLVCM